MHFRKLNTLCHPHPEEETNATGILLKTLLGLSVQNETTVKALVKSLAHTSQALSDYCYPYLSVISEHPDSTPITTPTTTKLPSRKPTSTPVERAFRNTYGHHTDLPFLLSELGTSD